MLSLVKQWKASGQTKQIFCNQHNITHHTLSYWVTKYNQSRQPSPGGFTPIDLSPAEAGHVSITYPNGVRISLNQAPLSLISQLIRLG